MLLGHMFILHLVKWCCVARWVEDGFCFMHTAPWYTARIRDGGGGSAPTVDQCVEQCTKSSRLGDLKLHNEPFMLMMEADLVL